MELTPEQQARLDNFEIYLTDWKAQALEKFKRGIVEHQGEDLDAMAELQDEIYDLVAYTYFINQGTL